MELDQKLRDIILKTANDVETIRKEFEKFEQRCIGYDQRIRKVEENQSYLAGKMTILVMGIGTVALIVTTFLMKLLK